MYPLADVLAAVVLFQPLLVGPPHEMRLGPPACILFDHHLFNLITQRPFFEAVLKEMANCKFDQPA